MDVTTELVKLEESDDLRGAYVCYACESGSRAWGFASPDSDYDLRFVYVRGVNDYLRLEKRRDVIEIPIRDDLDASGWDLGKFLTLMRKSNPSVYEWLGSPIVYKRVPGFLRVKELSERCFSPLASAHHYLGMAESTLRGRLRPSQVPPKGYLYVIRAILACRWAAYEQKPVPVRFDELRKAMLEPKMGPIVDEMLRLKAELPEKATIEHDSGLDEWISSKMDYLAGKVLTLEPKEPLPWGEFDDIFQVFVVGSARY